MNIQKVSELEPVTRPWLKKALLLRDTKESVRKALEQEMHRTGISASELAARMEISSKRISRIISGEEPASLDLLMAAVELLGMHYHIGVSVNHQLIEDQKVTIFQDYTFDKGQLIFYVKQKHLGRELPFTMMTMPETHYSDLIANAGERKLYTQIIPSAVLTKKFVAKHKIKRIEIFDLVGGKTKWLGLIDEVLEYLPG